VPKFISRKLKEAGRQKREDVRISRRILQSCSIESRGATHVTGPNIPHSPYTKDV
jgi:hypothetical protein